MSFSHYFSLGVNCQAAFQIRRVLGKDSASFFSWNVTKYDALISLLRSDFAGILEKDNLSLLPNAGLLFDSSHQYSLHSPFREGELCKGEAYEKKYAAFRAKMNYLISKFYSVAKSANRVAYFYVTQETAEARQNSIKVRDLLLKVHGRENFELIVLQDGARREESWKEPLIRNRYLARLAPWSDATDGHVRSWDRIFAEFPHVEPMRLAGYDRAAGSVVNLDNPISDLE